MISIPIAAAVGAAAGAVALGTVSAVHGDPTGLANALAHIPPSTHGYAVVSAVKAAMAGGSAGAAGGGGIGAAVAAVAKSLVGKAGAAAHIVH